MISICIDGNMLHAVNPFPNEHKRHFLERQIYFFIFFKKVMLPNTSDKSSFKKNTSDKSWISRTISKKGLLLESKYRNVTCRTTNLIAAIVYMKRESIVNEKKIEEWLSQHYIILCVCLDQPWVRQNHNDIVILLNL